MLRKIRLETFFFFLFQTVRALHVVIGIIIQAAAGIKKN